MKTPFSPMDKHRKELAVIQTQIDHIADIAGRLGRCAEAISVLYGSLSESEKAMPVAPVSTALLADINREFLAVSADMKLNNIQRTVRTGESGGRA